MVQFNLLPDVKLDFIKAEKSRRLVLGIGIIVSLASIALLVLLFSVQELQKKHISDLSKSITSESGVLQSKPDINTILTVQNQLESLTALHSAKPAADRVFTYLNEVTPAQVDINSFAVDFNQHTMTITGTTDTLSSVNQYVDTLKLTTYQVSGSSTNSPAFNGVVLTSFGVNNSQGSNKSQAASYTINLNFDPTIFTITEQVALTVPSITTHAQLQSPTNVFKSPTGN